jgi:hypothetical protein
MLLPHRRQVGDDEGFVWTRVCEPDEALSTSDERQDAIWRGEAEVAGRCLEILILEWGLADRRIQEDDLLMVFWKLREEYGAVAAMEGMKHANFADDHHLVLGVQGAGEVKVKRPPVKTSVFECGMAHSREACHGGLL